MSIKGILKQACETGDFVEITTDQNIYKEVTVMSLNNDTVDFNAMHLVKNCMHDFTLSISTIKMVEFE